MARVATVRKMKSHPAGRIRVLVVPSGGFETLSPSRPVRAVKEASSSIAAFTVFMESGARKGRCQPVASANGWSVKREIGHVPGNVGGAAILGQSCRRISVHVVGRDVDNDTNDFRCPQASGGVVDLSI